MSLSTISTKSHADSSLQNIFQDPLILGASVSADYFTDSPGKILALQYTTREHIQVVAQNGKQGRDMIKSLTPTQVQGRTVIIGVDLFFWDSFQASADASLKALDHLVEMASKAHAKLILGEVPLLTPQLQPSALHINDKIHQLCQINSRCRVLPLNKILHQVVRDGFIQQNGKKYNLSSLMPDGLHISAPASQFLADKIKSLF